MASLSKPNPIKIVLLFNSFVPDEVCQGEDESERAGKQNCFHIAGDYNAGGHLRVNVGDEAHLVASDVKRLVERGQELDTEDYVVLRVYS